MKDSVVQVGQLLLYFTFDVWIDTDTRIYEYRRHTSSVHLSNVGGGNYGDDARF